jgi:predicted PurR-regulated permease PerM
LTALVRTPKRASPTRARGDAPAEGAVPLRILTIVLALVGAVALAPLWAPLVLAAWTANLLKPLQQRLARRFRGSERAAAVVTSVVVFLILVPLVLLGVALVAAAMDAQTNLKQSKHASDALRAFLPAGPGLSLEHLNPQRVVDFLRRHGEGAASTLKATLGALTAAAIGLVVYVYATHECLVGGRRAYVWMKRRALVAPSTFDRLAQAFVETGRGLVIAIGGTALLQGAVATVGYAVVGVPSPLILGLITTAAALIPSIGTAIVWIPTTVFLLATDRVTAGIVLGLFGCVTSVGDNFVRPWLSRFGELRLSTFVTFVAMLGGLAAFGGFGLILGPLFVRLAVEALDIWREQRMAGQSARTS